MKLLIVSPYLPPNAGGVERVTQWMSDVLPPRGFVVRTVGHEIGGGSGDVIWPSRFHPVGVPIPSPSLSAGRALRQELAWADIVVIQNAFWPLSNLVGIGLTIRRRPALTIVHANASMPTPDAPIWLRLAEGLHARTIGRIQLSVAPPLAISTSSQAFIADHYHRSSKVLPLPLPDEFPPMRAPRSCRTPMRIVFCGRLAPAKAPIDALRACEIARESTPLVLDIVGDGPLAASMRSNVPEWARFHGALSWDAAVRAVASADVFLSSSVTDNAQTSLLEAMCLGVPSVATRIGEAQAYLSGPLGDALAAPSDPAGLADCVIAAARGYSQFEDATRKRGTELRGQHDGARVADRLAEYLSDAIRARRSPAAGSV